MELKFLKEKLERLEFLEEQFGLDIKNVSFAISRSSYLYCFYEVHASNFNENEIEFQLDVVAYDKDGDIIGVGHDFVLSIDSIGFIEGKIILDTILESNLAQIGKIRIYPRENI